MLREYIKECKERFPQDPRTVWFFVFLFLLVEVIGVLEAVWEFAESEFKYSLSIRRMLGHETDRYKLWYTYAMKKKW